jgi:tetratricopeptide (TPR) repeat protein
MEGAQQIRLKVAAAEKQKIGPGNVINPMRHQKKRFSLKFSKADNLREVGMKQQTHRAKFGYSLILTFSFLINFFSTAKAQDVVTSEDFTGGSSAYVFKNSRKATQKKVAFRAASTVQRTAKQRVQTTRSVIKQSVTVAKVKPKRVKTEEIDPRSAKYKMIDFKRKTPQETSVIFAGVGEYWLNLDNIDEALNVFREATVLDGKNQNARNGLSETLTRQGDKFLNDEKYDLAQPPYEEAITQNPNNAGAYAGLAEIFAAENDAPNAIKNYEKALALDADLTELNGPLGVLYYQTGEILKSEIALQKAIAANPDNAETQFFFGLVRYKQNRDDEALAAFRRSIQLDPTNEEVYYYLGEVYDRKENDKEAIAAYRRAVELKPKYTEAWFDLGAAYYNRASDQGANSVDYDEAIKAYKEVVKIKPTHGEAHANLADVYRQRNMLDEAISEYRLASTFIKDDPEIFSKFGYVASKRAAAPGYHSFWKMAFENFEKAVALNAQKPDYIDYQNLGWAYYNAAKSDIRLGNKTEAMGKMAKARDAFQKSIGLNPVPKVAAAIYLNLGMTLTDMGDFKGAAEALEKATGIEKNWIAAFNELGIAYRKNGEYDNAAKAFRRTIDIDENFYRGRYNLAESLFQGGKLSDAKKEFERLKKMKQQRLVDELIVATNGGITR